MTLSLLYFISFLLPFILCQGGGYSGREYYMDNVESSNPGYDSGCNYCCPPNDPVSQLTLEFYGYSGWVPIFFVVLIIILGCCPCFSKTTLYFIAKRFPYNGNFENDCIYHGYYKQSGEWTYMNNITLYFKENKIKGSGRDSIGSYEILGDYAIRPISLIKTYKLGTGNIFENFGHDVDINLIPSKIEGDTNPIFLGDYYVIRNKSRGLWFIIPQSIKMINPLEFLKECHSKILIIQYVILFLITVSSLVYWGVNKSKYEFEHSVHDSDKIIGLQIGGILSLIALVAILIWHNNFKMSFIRNSCSFNFIRYFTQLVIAIICFIFGMFDMVVADFVKNQNLYSKNQSSNIVGIQNYCNFNFECNTIWAAKYTYTDWSCSGFTKIICVSFHSSMGDCYQGKENLYNYLFGNSLFSWLLFNMWIIFLISQVCLSDSFTAIYRNKLLELNKNSNNSNKTNVQTNQVVNLNKAQV